jgi:hypothetical protein
VIEQLIEFLRKEVLVEVHSRGEDRRELSYGLTQRGRDQALDAFAKSGYVGPAPVPLTVYCDLVQAQSIHGLTATREKVAEIFAEVVLRDSLREQLGPAMNSGRAIFIYGPAGTGKTYITRKLTGLFSDSCLIPYAIAVNEQVVALFDPLLHRPVEEAIQSPSLLFEQGYDPRFVRCRRPVVVTGGELGMDMLEVYFNPVTREYQAPLQLKANNGIFIIDDMGRQRAEPMQIFNRWIVPMEEKRDFLSLGAGKHFLRRIGYKIHFGYLDADEYGRIWRQVCDENRIPFDPALLRYVLEELHDRHRMPLRPCHPRDLLGMALDRARFQNDDVQLTTGHLDWAWSSYFVQINTEVEVAPRQPQLDLDGGASHV